MGRGTNIDHEVLGGSVQAARQGDGLGDVLQSQVRQEDLLGHADSHLTSVTGKGPAVTWGYIGLKGIGIMGAILCRWVILTPTLP